MQLRSMPRASWDCLRVYLGVALFMKGLVFLKDSGAVLALLEGGKVPFAGHALAEFVAVTHLAGGLLLAFGLFTRLAAAMQIPNLLGAVVLIHMKEGLFTKAQTLEFSILVLFLLGLFTASGAGQWSIDHHFAEIDKAPKPTPEPAKVSGVAALPKMRDRMPSFV
jgi:uncharacterized membrane protein YphA (DoxX/SURF4 family)